MVAENRKDRALAGACEKSAVALHEITHFVVITDTDEDCAGAAHGEGIGGPRRTALLDASALGGVAIGDPYAKSFAHEVADDGHSHSASADHANARDDILTHGVDNSSIAQARALSRAGVRGSEPSRSMRRGIIAFASPCR